MPLSMCVLVCCTICMYGSYVCSAKDILYHLQDNSVINKTYRRFTNTDRIVCAVECAKDPWCLAAFYDEVLRTCDLSSYAPDEAIAWKETKQGSRLYCRNSKDLTTVSGIAAWQSSVIVKMTLIVRMVTSISGRMVKEAVAEYMDYATIHGLGRTKNSPFAALKILWVLALCGSLGMITWQVVMLYRKYDSHPVSTTMEMKIVKQMKFPKIVICNTNLLDYSRFPSSHPLESPLNEAAKKYAIDKSIYNSNYSLFTYNYTNFDKVTVPTDFDADIMINTAEKFKMQLSNLSDVELKNFSQPYNRFVLSCSFAGKSCSPSAIGSNSSFRTYDYGQCYVFDPQGARWYLTFREVSSSGQRYGLELLLNVDESQSIPFVTSSSGVLICPLNDVGEYLDANAGVFVPTGFQADIAVSKSENERVPGKNNESPMCDVNSDKPVYDCLLDCRQENIALRCGCYQQFFRYDNGKVDSHINKTYANETDIRACLSDKDYVCILKALDEFTNSTPSGCKCNNPCREEFYTPDVTLITWPNEKFLPILRRIITAKLPNEYVNGFDRNKIRDNFLLVRIYLKTLSYEVIKETYAYEIVNFVSDIGGQLGLWAGFSVLSILEIVELMFLLVTKKDNKAVPEEGDGKMSKETEQTEQTLTLTTYD